MMKKILHYIYCIKMAKYDHIYLAMVLDLTSVINMIYVITGQHALIFPPA